MTSQALTVNILIEDVVVKTLQENFDDKEVSVLNLIDLLGKAQKSVNAALTEIIDQDKQSQENEMDFEEDAIDSDDSEEVNTPAKRKSKTDNGKAPKVRKV